MKINTQGALAWERYTPVIDIGGVAIGGEGRPTLVGSSSLEGFTIYVDQYESDGPSFCAEIDDMKAAPIVFPNPPTSDRVSVALSIKESSVQFDVEVDVLDTMYQKVYAASWTGVSYTNNVVTISGLDQWAPGVYLIRARLRESSSGEEYKTGVARLVIAR